MSILNQNSLSFCQPAFSALSERELFAKAVCRIPLTAERRQYFAKPPLPSIAAASESFARPSLPPLNRPLRAGGGLNSAQLNRLFEKVIGHGRVM